MGMIRYNDKNYTAGEAERKANSYVLEALEKHKGDFENSHKVTAEQAGAYTTEETDKKISAHTDRKDNPHNTTKAQVGLSNVDNTADIDKPISTKQQEALDLKADITLLNSKIAEIDDKKADKATTLSGYGITDAYTKEETAEKISEKDDFVISGKIIQTTDDAGNVTYDVTINTTPSKCMKAYNDGKNMRLSVAYINADNETIALKFSWSAYILGGYPVFSGALPDGSVIIVWLDSSDRTWKVKVYDIDDVYTKDETDVLLNNKLDFIEGVEAEIDEYYGIRDEDRIWHPQMYKITSEDAFGMTHYYYLYAIPTNSAAIVMPQPPPYTYQYKICAGGIYMRKDNASRGWSEWAEYVTAGEVDDLQTQIDTLNTTTKTLSSADSMTLASANAYTDTKIGEIDTVLDEIIALQNSYIGGDAE